ncbi:hypothetical protein [Pseudonocardia acidicola]|uniref:ABC-2 type transport system permease protein n=1 Tax=Pseudonocardia acidicola TaxID=2724939 RepID=A0ABX1SM77_9PSEU|nr:hypothetical protein [Pseudonocardia acidicola]NMI01943.1 hypothetical protein [Pseudonocardia acidicola]
MTLMAVERIKLASTRSPWWCAALALAVTVGLAALLAGLAQTSTDVGVATTQAGYRLGMVIMMVMAALAVTTEYRFGTIRTTFQAAPNRSAVLVAKTAVVALVAGAVGLLTAFASWGVAWLLVPAADLALDTGAEWRAVAGVGPVYLLAAVLAVAVGILVRQSAAAVAILLVWPLLVENLVMLVPHVGATIHSWLPFAAFDAFLGAGPAPAADAPYGPWGALGYVAAVALALLAAAIAVARHRDA